MPEANQTEKPTAQRRRKAREQGQVARSRDLPGLLAIAGAVGAVMLMSSDIAGHWRTFYSGLLGNATGENFSGGGPLLFWSALEVMRWTVPTLLTGLVLAVAAGLVQGGINFAPAALQPKPERFLPSQRLKQVFSLTSLSGLLKSLIPFAAILLIGVHALQEHWDELARAGGTDLRRISAVVAALALQVAWKAGLVLLAWAVVDYALVWRQSENSLRMSREELKKEHKENDGNPHTKQQVRKVQRAMRKRRSLQAAATATLVVTNPTHFAVALKYEQGMPAPEIVAKGRDLLAQQIKKIAYENGVMVMENKPLAQSLYKSVEVGDTIPAQLYQAVAELLVVVYRAQAEVREQERMRRQRDANGQVVPAR